MTFWGEKTLQMSNDDPLDASVDSSAFNQECNQESTDLCANILRHGSRDTGQTKKASTRCFLKHYVVWSDTSSGASPSKWPSVVSGSLSSLRMDSAGSLKRLSPAELRLLMRQNDPRITITSGLAKGKKNFTVIVHRLQRNSAAVFLWAAKNINNARKKHITVSVHEFWFGFDLDYVWHINLLC